ncbi:MAG: glycosyl transferase family 2 [Bacteroidales bacterium]|nr:glycosyl transferase family 2 [Bacteroidales bacterium]
MSEKAKNTGIIIQARAASSRFPRKLLLPFYKNDSILDILMSSITSQVKNSIKIILATTTRLIDLEVLRYADKYKIEGFKGSESDVLHRFIDAADFYGLDQIVRICADNPFFDAVGTMKLLDYHEGDLHDYTAYYLDGDLPSIKSHLGFWGEVVSTSALKKIQDLTDKPVYREHVTNYIYTHPDLFSIQKINAPDPFFTKKDIRLTVDTETDFGLAREMYKALFEINPAFSTKDILQYIMNNPDVKLQMNDQILKNSK